MRFTGEQGLSKFGRVYVLVSAVLLAAGAAFHLAIIAGGATWYAFSGAPPGLTAMLAHGSLRPMLSCVFIASVLAACSAYGLSWVGTLSRLPALRVVLAFIAAGLLARGLLLPAAAALRPHLLLGLCGRCQAVNPFVIVTSALCLFAGGAYALAAFRPAPTGRSRLRRKPARP
jgi:hypothetical protein